MQANPGLSILTLIGIDIALLSRALSRFYQLSTTDLSLAHTGFAGALAQVSLPPLSIPMTLLVFNLGSRLAG